MCTYQRSKQYTYVQCRGKVTKTVTEVFFFVQWQLSHKETVKHVLAVWNMPRITTLYERFVLDIVS